MKEQDCENDLMTESFKIRLSGLSILLLGLLPFVTSFAPAVLRGGQSPTAGMLGLFGIFALVVGIKLSIANLAELNDAAVRRLCVALGSLTFAAVGGFFGVLLQRTGSFDRLGLLYFSLLVVFAGLGCSAALACAGILRGRNAAFRAPSESFLTLGGKMDALSFLVLQPALILFAVFVGKAIAGQVGGTQEGALLANVLGLAVLPLFLMLQISLISKRCHDTEPFGALVSSEGRTGRGAFWLAQLGLLEVDIIAGLLAQAWGHSPVVGAVVYFVWLPIAFGTALCVLIALGIGLCVQVKRWHDRGKSGWMVLLNLVPIFGTLWSLVELGFLRGDSGPNRFGDAPLAARQDKVCEAENGTPGIASTIIAHAHAA